MYFIIFVQFQNNKSESNAWHFGLDQIHNIRPFPHLSPLKPGLAIQMAKPGFNFFGSGCEINLEIFRITDHHRNNACAATAG